MSGVAVSRPMTPVIAASVPRATALPLDRLKTLHNPGASTNSSNRTIETWNSIA